MRYIILMIAVLYFVYKGIEFILPSSWLESNPQLPFMITIYIYIIYLAYFILWKPVTKFIKELTQKSKEKQN
jgi:Tfp pilus assembly protein PilO